MGRKPFVAIANLDKGFLKMYPNVKGTTIIEHQKGDTFDVFMSKVFLRYNPTKPLKPR